MGKIAFEINNEGMAINGRFVKEDYIPQGNEQIIDGDDCSIIGQYHTNDYKKKINKDETEILAGEKADSLLPNPSERRKMKTVSRGVKLVLKKVKGTTSAEEEAELDALEALDDAIDAIYDAADLIKGQIDLDVNYDHINSPLWP